MANTTFNGPVRSENGFQTISINQSTGTVTVTGTFGAATSVTSLAATTVAATSTVTARRASGLTAGGAAGFIGTNVAAGMGVYFGSGAPTVAAAQGSLYLRSDGSSTSTRAYVNTNGTTGWAAITTAS
jgi:hypothetical protein